MKNLRILCTADLHLGRRLVEMPEGLERYVQAPKEAWSRLVEYALEPGHAIDAVVIAGDIFDNEQDLYEAIGIFEKGLDRLCKQGIPVVAVAGNHDVRVLGKCRKRMERKGFYLLGEMGEWEECSLVLKGIKVTFFGWSFTSVHCTKSPLESFPEFAKEGVTIGVLHGDTEGGGESLYAPIDLRLLEGLGPQAWVLGHLHAPRVLMESPLVFYCGSLQGLDPTEKGEHGASLLEVTASGALLRHFTPIAPLLWSCEEIDMTRAEVETLDDLLNSELQQRLQEIFEEVEAVMCRVVLTGRTTSYPYLKPFKERVEGRLFSHVGSKAAPCYIESVQLDCRPDIDLAALSRGKDAVAILARTLLALEGGEEEARLCEEAFAFLLDKMKKAPQVEQRLSNEELRASLIGAGYEAIDLLLSQKED